MGVEISDLTVVVDTTQGVKGFHDLKVAAAEATHGVDSFQAANARQLRQAAGVDASLKTTTSAVATQSKEYTKLDADVVKYMSTQDRNVKALAALTKAETLLTDARRAGVLSQQQYTANMAQASAAYVKATESAEEATNRAGMTASETRRRISSMTAALVTGNINDFTQHMVRMSSRMVPITPQTVAIGAAVLAMGGYFIYAQVKAESLNREIAKLQAQFAGTGRQGLTTAQDLNVMMQSLDRMSGISHEAAEKIVSAFAKEGGIGKKMLQPLIAMVPDFAAAIGEDAPAAAAKLAKSFGDPIEGVMRLDKELNFLTLSQLKQIEKMKEQGDAAGIAAIGMKALEERIDGLNKMALTPLEQALNDLSRTWAGTMKSLKDNSSLVTIVVMANRLLVTLTSLPDKLRDLGDAARAAAGLAPRTRNDGKSGGKTDEELAVEGAKWEAEQILAIETDRLEKQRAAKDKWLRVGKAAAEKALQEEIEFAQWQAKQIEAIDKERFDKEKKMLEDHLKNELAAYVKWTDDVADAQVAAGQIALKAQRAYIKEGEKAAAESMKQQMELLDMLGNKFGEFAVSFKGGWKGAMDYAKQTFGDLAQQVIAFFAKKFFLNVAANGTFGSSLQGAASSMLSGGGSGGGGMGTSLIGTGLSAAGSYLFGTAATGAGGAMMLGSATGAGAITAGTAGTAGIIGSGGLTATVTSALAAIPVWGWIAIAAMAAYAAFGGKGGGPKTSGTSIYDLANGQVTEGPMSDARRFYNTDDKSMDGTVGKVVKATADTFSELLKMFDPKNKNSFTFTQSMDTDPQGTASNRVATQLFMDGMKIFEQKNENLGRDNEKIAPEMQLQLQRAMVAGLQKVDLGEEMNRIFKNVNTSSMTTEEYTALVAQATELSNVMKYLSTTTLPGLTLEIVRTMQVAGESLTQTTQRIANQWAVLSDTFKTDDERLADITKAYTSLFNSIDVAVPKTAEEFEALIAGLDVTTEAGRALFDVLSLTATGFKQVADAATAARTGLDGAIGSRNTQYARNTTLSQRNDIAQQFADALGVGFGEDLLSRMALSPESFEGLSTASMNLLTRFLGLQTSLEQLDDRLNETGRVITDVYLPVWQSPHERAEEERVRRHQEELDAAARRRDLGRPIAEYLIGSQQSNYSPLTPRQQLEAARQAYNANQALASSGDEYAMGRWSQLREALLAIGQRVNGSGSAEQVELFRSTYEQGRLLSGGQAPPLTITAFNTGNQQVVSAITTAEAQRQVDARSAQELMEQLIASLIDAQRETREATAEAIAVQERMRAEMRKANSKS